MSPATFQPAHGLFWRWQRARDAKRSHLPAAITEPNIQPCFALVVTHPVGRTNLCLEGVPHGQDPGFSVVPCGHQVVLSPRARRWGDKGDNGVTRVCSMTAEDPS